MKRLLKVALVGTILVLAIMGTGSIVSAGAPDAVDGDGGTAFLCPAVGGPNAGGPLPGGQNTFLPGHNQAGAHSNYHSWNTLGPLESPGPGNGNSDWSPIWPPAGD